MTAAPATAGLADVLRRCSRACRCRRLRCRQPRRARRSSAATTCRWRSTSCSCRCSPSTSRPATREAASASWSTCVNLAAAAAPPAARPVGQAGQHPAHRLDQPRRLARPGAAPAGPLRPAPHLRAAAQARPAPADRPLPRPASRTLAELDSDERRDALAAVTQGYSPAMLERLMDEALVQAVRGERSAMTWADVEHARLQVEVGLGQPVAYTDHERELIATHEAGHATVAWLVAPQRRLEILTIVKRREALGLLAHGDREDVYTRSRTELIALIQIAMGGQVAEELFFGDVSTGPGRRPAVRDQRRGPDGRRGRHDRHPGLVRRGAEQRASATPTWSAGCSATPRAGAGSRRCCSEQKVVVARPARGQPAPRRGAARRTARPVRADRPRDHRRPRGGRGCRAAPGPDRRADHRPALHRVAGHRRVASAGAPGRACRAAGARRAGGRAWPACSAPSRTRTTVAALPVGLLLGLGLSVAEFVTSGLLPRPGRCRGRRRRLARRRAADGSSPASRGRPRRAGHCHRLRLAARRDRAGGGLRSRCAYSSGRGRPMIRPMSPEATLTAGRDGRSS